MYNRYIRNDQGGYSRVQVEEDAAPFQNGSQPFSGGSSPSDAGGPQPFSQRRDEGHGQQESPGAQAPHGESSRRGHREDGKEGGKEGGRDGLGISAFLRRILDKFHLENVDTGDVILLLLLFFLFKEDADEELLIALGLMLIL